MKTHWPRTRLCRIASFNPTKKCVATRPDDTKVTFLPMEAVSADGAILTPRTRLLGEVYNGYSYFKRGDVLVAKITPCFENGKGALVAHCVNGIGFGTTEFHVVRPGAGVLPQFLFYVTRLDELRRVGAASMTGAAGQQRVSEDFLKDFEIGLPPLATQRAIADFLDRKTAAIDALVEKKERLLELLAEKRAALIHHAVTKGPDPDAPMKDSGVPWIGEIPAHWAIRRLKHISPRITVGVVVNPSEYVDDTGDLPFIYGSDVSEMQIDVAGARRIRRSDSERLAKTRLAAGDILCVRVGAPGVTAVVPASADGGNCASVVIVRQSSSFDSQWFAYALNSPIGRANVALVAYGAAQKQFNIAHAVDFVLPVPPSPEQVAVASRLDDATQEWRRISSRVTAQITRLREYRQALITAAVTGKIDVTGEESSP